MGGPLPPSLVTAEAHASETTRPLFERSIKIYPRATRGTFRSWRWIFVALTQLVYYGLPWLDWHGRQAVLFDLASRKFFVFGIVLFPQDFIYLTGLLVISALSLFLFTAVAGRLWCGYACPQTVYTDLFIWIEHRIQGDHVRRQRLVHGPWTLKRLGLQGATLGAWATLALWTGFTFVGYFVPIKTLGHDFIAFDANGWVVFWMLFYASFTYLQAGVLREQVCKTMCPYARFQSAMFDRDTLTVTYDGKRGELRGSRPRHADPRGLGLGDCVDCGVCVQVCPTGIDIRDGLQSACIGCGACIDGCNDIMNRMGYARGLIRYTTEHALENKLSKRETFKRAIRPRTLIYSGILLVLVASWAASLAVRPTLRMDVIRDRGMLARELDGGLIENVYRVQLMNLTESAQRVMLGTQGLHNALIASDDDIALGPTESRFIVIRVQTPRDATHPGMNALTIQASAANDNHGAISESTTFYSPITH